MISQQSAARTGGRIAGQGGVGDLPDTAGSRIAPRGPQRVTIHRGIIERRQRFRREHVLSQHAPAGRDQRAALDRQGNGLTEQTRQRGFIVQQRDAAAAPRYA